MEAQHDPDVARDLEPAREESLARIEGAADQGVEVGRGAADEAVRRRVGVIDEHHAMVPTHEAPRTATGPGEVEADDGPIRDRGTHRRAMRSILEESVELWVRCVHA